MPILNPSNVPASLLALLTWAECWGINDDWTRTKAVQSATREQLFELVHCIDDIRDQDLFDWLAGPESFREDRTNEYIALTCLIMSIDQAKALLK